MDQEEQLALYQKAWETRGPEKQIDMLIEEMAELTQALLKARRQGVTFNFQVHEEIADVGICMGQLEIQIARDGSFPTVLKIQERKLLRLKERLDREE